MTQKQIKALEKMLKYTPVSGCFSTPKRTIYYTQIGFLEVPAPAPVTADKGLEGHKAPIKKLRKDIKSDETRILVQVDIEKLKAIIKDIPTPKKDNRLKHPYIFMNGKTETRVDPIYLLELLTLYNTDTVSVSAHPLKAVAVIGEGYHFGAMLPIKPNNK